MTKHVNQVIICGTLEADPIITETDKGRRAFIRVATTEFYTDKGQEKAFTNWHAISVFRADQVAKVEGLAPGAKVLIEGRNRSGSYEKSGETRYTYEVEPISIKLV